MAPPDKNKDESLFPNLFVNAPELEQLRARLKTEPWRAALLQRVRKEVFTPMTIF